jgi:hypothetical protein
MGQHQIPILLAQAYVKFLLSHLTMLHLVGRILAPRGSRLYFCWNLLIALVCGPVPAGYARWSLQLLADDLVKIEGFELESISYEAVRQTLKKRTERLG